MLGLLMDIFEGVWFELPAISERLLFFVETNPELTPYPTPAWFMFRLVTFDICST